MTELLTLLTSGQTATTTGQGGNDIVSILTMLIPLALMIVIFYFLIIRPEKKRGKKMQEMLNNLEVANLLYRYAILCGYISNRFITSIPLASAMRTVCPVPLLLLLWS